MPLTETQIQELGKIFFSYANKHRNEFFGTSEGRLAHYTTAENAIKIIQSKSLWMRNARLMDDFSEIRHGKSMLNDYLYGIDRANLNKLKDALKKINVEINWSAELDALWNALDFATYIICFSEHKTVDDKHGRLSMWRGFGRAAAAVAIIFNNPPEEEAKNLPIVLSPVSYANQEEFAKELDEVVHNIEKSADFLTQIDSQTILEWLHWMFTMTVVSLKHSSFIEEKEWRAVHLPPYFNNAVGLALDTVTLSGIPQKIYKFGFKNIPEKGISKIELNDLVERVIVGPSQYADSIREALIIEMEKAEIENAKDKVFYSNIPLK